MTKIEVEKNEEGLFKKWIDQTDQIVKQWQKGPEEEKKEGEDETKEEPAPSNVMPRSPTYYERNLEVWRQLCVPKF